MIRLTVMLLAAGALTACGDVGNEKQEAVIPGHMVESLDRAENVEDVLRRAEQRRREQGEN